MYIFVYHHFSVTQITMHKGEHFGFVEELAAMKPIGYALFLYMFATSLFFTLFRCFYPRQLGSLARAHDISMTIFHFVWLSFAGYALTFSFVIGARFMDDEKQRDVYLAAALVGSVVFMLQLFLGLTLLYWEFCTDNVYRVQVRLANLVCIYTEQRKEKAN